MKRVILSVFCAAAVLVAGCTSSQQQSSTTAPSSTSLGSLVGNWASSDVVQTPVSGCTDFKWTVAQFTGTAASGSFSATCPGDLKVTGTAQGSLSGTTISWSAQGTGSGPGGASCAFSLRGTAEILADSVRVPYSGDTCLGKVSGTEILKRK